MLVPIIEARRWAEKKTCVKEVFKGMIEIVKLGDGDPEKLAKRTDMMMGLASIHLAILAVALACARCWSTSKL